MNNYYFTFGQDHRDVHGFPLKNFWVRVVAGNYNRAREVFIQQFSSQYMTRPDKWAFQYEEPQFKPELFPSGELTVFMDNIRQPEIINNKY